MAEHSRKQSLLIAAWVGVNQKRFDELFSLFTGDENILAQRSGWPLSTLVEENPAFISKHFSALLRNIGVPGRHPAVLRNTIRLLQFAKIPARYEGRIMDMCFGFIADPAEAPAVKADSLTILEKMAFRYPEIFPELRTIIEENFDRETPSFKARARKILKRRT